jgi:hypothetical protein
MPEPAAARLRCVELSVLSCFAGMLGWRDAAIGLAFIVTLDPSAAKGAAEPKTTGRQPAGSEVPGNGSTAHALVGRFLLSERPADQEVPDGIELRSDGKCLVDFDQWLAMVAVCTASPQGALHVYTGMPHQIALDGTYRLGKYTLTVARPGEGDLIYVRTPAGPHPPEADIQGIFLAHSELGDAATELGPHHTYRVHLIDLTPDHTFYDIHLSGHYGYADGVITYAIEHSTGAPQGEKYARDVALKRDKYCLWIVDQFHDTAICQALVTTIDLPPAPSGYRPAPIPPATR